MEITLTINKEDVMREVAVTTAYTGGKMMGNDEDALQRISTVDEDEALLGRFWEESRTDICHELIDLVTFEGMVLRDMYRPIDPPSRPSGAADTDTKPRLYYELRLDVSKSFDDALLPSMEVSLRSFFVHNIVAKWYVYTNKQEAGDYADKAVMLLDDVHRKAVYKKRPTRPTYDD